MHQRKRLAGLVLVAAAVAGVTTIGVVAPAHADTTATITVPDTIAPGVPTPARADVEIVPPTDPGDLPVTIQVSTDQRDVATTGSVNVDGFWSDSSPGCDLADPTLLECAWPDAADGEARSINLALTATPDASGLFVIEVLAVTADDTEFILTDLIITVGDVPDGTVELNLTTTADTQVRSGNETIDAGCFSGEVVAGVVPPGVTTGTSGPTPVSGNTSCFVQVYYGVGPGVEVTTTATISTNGSPPIPYQIGEQFAVPAGSTVVIDAVSVATVPPPPVPPNGGGVLPATGPNTGLRIGILIAGFTALGGGAVLYNAARRQRRTV